MQKFTLSSGFGSMKPHGRFAVAALSLAAALACGGAAAQGRGNNPGTESFSPGRILVMPRAGMPDDALDKILGQQGGGKGRRVGKTDLRIVDLPPGLEKNMVERLTGHPHIEFAELDALIPRDVATNDPYLGSQWHLPKIRVTEAWASTTGSGVVVAILDSGVEPDHPDLKDRLVAGYNFYDGNTNTSDVFGHGTKVAGSAAATLNNGTGVASVAGAAKIMPIRVTGTDGYASISMLAQGITYAADKGARVANLSFAASSYSSIRSAAQYMKDKGGLVFVSAGNSGKDPGESSTSSLIVVSATDGNDVKTSWSNYGSHVHLAAPGSGIYTTATGKTYASVSGTSFSAPISAGVAALAMAANPGLSSSKVESILFSTALDLGSSGKDAYYGFGRVDAGAVVAEAMSTASDQPAADTEAPQVAIASPTGGATVSGLATVDVSASDNVGVAKVELWVNGSLLASDTTSPFGFSWETTKIANGGADLVAKAYDKAGNAATSATVAVNVSNSTSTATTDTTPPTATITNPADGSTVPAGTVKVTAGATDNSGLSGLSMTLSIGGKKVASSSGSGKIEYGWNTRRLKSGTYTLTVSAKDAVGNSSSTSVTVRR
jgi:hypothetical protein